MVLPHGPARDDDRRALYARVQADLAREHGPVAWLRALPTWLRGTIAAFAALASVTLTALLVPRADLADHPRRRLALTLTTYAAGAATALWAALRPLQRPPLRRGLVPLVVIFGVVVPFVAAMLPDPHALPRPAAGDFVTQALTCLVRGAALALPILVLAWALDRRAHGTRRAAWLAVVFAGLTAVAELDLHCPISDPLHLGLSHATVVLALGLAYARGWRSG